MVYKIETWDRIFVRNEMGLNEVTCLVTDGNRILMQRHMSPEEFDEAQTYVFDRCGVRIAPVLMGSSSLITD